MSSLFNAIAADWAATFVAVAFLFAVSVPERNGAFAPKHVILGRYLRAVLKRVTIRRGDSFPRLSRRLFRAPTAYTINE